MASKVYFTDFRTNHEQSLTEKLQKLIRKAGMDTIDFEGKFVAIKMHFGEPGNLAFLRPNYAKSGGGRGEGAGRQALPHRLQHPLPGSPQERPGAPAGSGYENGFNYISCGCPHHHR